MKEILHKLRAMKEILNNSPFFSSHEMIGSGLLFVWDSTGKAGVTIIDFGKTIPRENPAHNIYWDENLQNHADGYMIGLDSILSIMDTLMQSSGKNPLEASIVNSVGVHSIFAVAPAPLAIPQVAPSIDELFDQAIVLAMPPATVPAPATPTVLPPFNPLVNQGDPFGGFTPEDVDQGTRVAIPERGEGVVLFIGMHAVDGKPRVGVKLDSPNGLNNGTIKGHTYFTCEDKYGVLALPGNVRRVSQQ